MFGSHSRWVRANRLMRGALTSAAAGVLGLAVLTTGADPAAAAPPPIQFAPATNYSTGSVFGPGPGAETTVSTDLNNDGHPDLVITDLTTTNPVAILNHGDGTFGSPTALPFASGVLSIATGDFNGDGNADVVGRSEYSVVLWTGNGNGAFTLAQQVASLGNAQPALAVADVNHDGRPDVVTPTISGFAVFVGNGNGISAGPATTAVGVFSDVAVANLNGDGDADLVLVDATPLLQRVRIYLGNGNGTFRAAGSGATGLGPEAASIGDLNHDGIDDVVTSDSFSVLSVPPQFSITVLLSNGSGGFASSATYPTASGPVSGAVGDLNGDGNADVVVAGVAGTSLAVYANDGSGHLSPPAAVTVAPLPQSPVIDDFDGDSRPDVAVPGVGQLSVLRNVS